MSKRKGLAASGQTRDLLSAHGAGKGDHARPMAVPRHVFDANYDAIDWGERCPAHPKYRAVRAPSCDCERCHEIWNRRTEKPSRKFFKNYGSNCGPRSRRYLPDQIKVQRGIAAQRKWQAEYDSIARDCAQTNAELRADGYDTQGN